MGQNYSLLDTAIRRYTGYNVTTEYRFHPSREWLFDFAIPEVKVGIEVEGGIWNGGINVLSLSKKLTSMGKYDIPLYSIAII